MWFELEMPNAIEFLPFISSIVTIKFKVGFISPKLSFLLPLTQNKSFMSKPVLDHMGGVTTYSDLRGEDFDSWISFLTSL